ncbi:MULTISPECIES: 50S ribosomal protein L4 [Actinopolyspora]|uniref:Large ribosomal subunit protein uL4 n=1 Tax=Actinopolyspora saharensis TaxID=995062 RepID=A0A1H1GIT6_9ACTN|nr:MULTISPECIES: 50S ribosomal protein L4 [Actinopolyspora]NHD16600.1 50S ribosomal protein L4 [Actinopolyspora sp. BKK2]NHE75537.1 50S ribosomal protein L4 [Actinopolyspora sp. BKK1]SDR13152.1 large subunit ribosomal protein L4 [Actinopolyspora saharensis]
MAAKLDVRTPDGNTDGQVDLPAELFDAKANVPLMHQVVTAQLAAARQGTHSVKTRGEVAGGSKKPYRQKGTGNARQGSIRAPQFVGGGTVHGPTPRDYSQRTPKKMKAAALRSALSDRARADQIHVVTEVTSGEKPSTKEAKATLRSVTDARRVLVVLNSTEETAWLSLRNLPHVHILDPGQLNTYDVLVNDDVVFSKAAFERFVAERSPKRSAKTAVTPDATSSQAEEADQ